MPWPSSMDCCKSSLLPTCLFFSRSTRSEGNEPMRTMGLIEPVMMIVAGFSRHHQLLEQAKLRLEECFGPIALTGPTIEFRNTAYYEATMGAGLLKSYWAFSLFQEPDQLAQVKRKTIELEQETISSLRFPET